MSARVSRVIGTGSLVAAQVISATPKVLQEIVCTNTGAAVAYCQVFNTTAVPADSAVPEIVFAVPAGATASYDNQQGIEFDTGICVATSSTAHVKTIKFPEAVFHALVGA